MVRKLKFHERKLLKKVDFIDWELDNNLHENQVMAKFGIQKRAHYLLYNKLSKNVRFFFLKNLSLTTFCLRFVNLPIN